MPKFNRADITEAYLIFALHHAGTMAGEKAIVRLWYMPKRCYRPLHDRSQLTPNGLAILEGLLARQVKAEADGIENLRMVDEGPDTIPVPQCATIPAGEDPFLDGFFS